MHIDKDMHTYSFEHAAPENMKIYIFITFARHSQAYEIEMNLIQCIQHLHYFEYTHSYCEDKLD